MTTPLSSHATLIQRAPTLTPTVFTDIAELGDVTPPEISRKAFDASVQNKTIDVYVMGMLRRGAVSFPLNFIPNDATHDHVAGLYFSMINGAFDGFKFYQTSSGFLWVASGFVQAIKPKAPVDGKWAADVTLQFSGGMGISSNGGANMVTII